MDNPQKHAVADRQESLCAQCSKLNLRQMLKGGVTMEDAIPLDTMVNVLAKASTCKLCSLISNVLRRTWLLDKHDYPDIDFSPIQLTIYARECGNIRDPPPPVPELAHRLFIRPIGRPIEVIDAMIAAETALELEIQLMEEDAHLLGRSPDLHGRRVTEVVDMGLVKRWMGICEGTHEGLCASAWWREGETATLPSTVRMVDVRDSAIVQVPPGCRYVALSYMWGIPGDSYWTTSTNLAERSQPGGLPKSALPTVISDTILLMRDLGERYLWVDSLCIKQDDPSDKAFQISAMERIYGCSLFTIFAAGGTSANAPLPGLRPGTRVVHQQIEEIQGLHLSVPLPTPQEALAHSRWMTRGWTYQELMLSRRRLYFTDDQVFFECLANLFGEDLVAESPGLVNAVKQHPFSVRGGGQFISAGRPSDWLRQRWVWSFMHVLSKYTRRHLSVETDIIDAMSALTNACAQGFRLAGGDPRKAFHYGMPVTEMDLALLWTPDPYAPHERRVLEEYMGNKIPWPSWAWSGWRGRIRYMDDGQFAGLEQMTIYPGLDASLVDRWFIVDEDLGLTQLEVSTFIEHNSDHADVPRPYVIPRWDRAWSIPSNVHLKPGTLVFRTSLAPFRVAVADSASYEDYSTLVTEHHAIFSVHALNSPQDVVGRIILPAMHPSPATIQLLALSRCKKSDNLPWVTPDTNIVEQGFLLNVMATRPVSEVGKRERIGVGVILERAWVEASLSTDVIMLQ
ncbi:HET-domain-containing protein [Coniophora puteana RWD-64-598 SS2]|uniref:HET-domain-containing protein n=1 Tax=Coniophora puteana (strain RWD-64-598) TaxID=741705 RepID=A0A5M3N7E1_CONPW|nr:HET-domain-containing protein [Coniophora puteana RWD-64-598 SS2]EIW87353.1 HET-domain-containing protein [Coniophora puteana RWD-64-598 SS2]